MLVVIHHGRIRSFEYVNASGPQDQIYHDLSQKHYLLNMMRFK